MSIIDRIRRLAEANINHLLDRSDTPELALTEKVGELETTIEEAKTAVAGFAVTHKRLEKNIASLQQTSDEWHQKAAGAVKRGDDETARRALGERAKVTDRLGRLTPSLESSATTYADLKDDLVRLHDQLQAAQAKLRELQSRQRAAKAQKAFGDKVGKMSSEASGAQFDSFEDAVVEAEVGVEIDRELRAETSSLDGRLQKQEQTNRVDADLDALKRELAAGS
jgi:phage shock protein A